MDWTPPAASWCYPSYPRTQQQNTTNELAVSATDIRNDMTELDRARGSTHTGMWMEGTNQGQIKLFTTRQSTQTWTWFHLFAFSRRHHPQSGAQGACLPTLHLLAAAAYGCCCRRWFATASLCNERMHESIADEKW